MLKVLILYSSTDGHTYKICKRISERIEKSGEADIATIADANIYNLDSFDRIIIGASIRYGKHNPKVYEFIKQNLQLLESKDSSFFSVNVVARKQDKNTPDTNPYIQKFLSISEWKPKRIGVFAGKIDYNKYGFIDKHMIRLIMWIGKGPTDLSGVYEFTDWTAVDKFSDKVVGSI